MKNRRVLTAITAITAAIIIFLVVALGTARAESVPTYFVYTPAANQSITTPNGNSYTSDINHLIYNPNVLDINFLVSIGGVVLNQRDNVAAGPPTANNDYTQLYGIGSQWYNTLNNLTYTLTNPGSTPGNATWVGATSAAISVGSTAIIGGSSGGILYNNAANLGNLGTLDNGVLITSASGAPSISTTLPAAVQANITNVGSTIYSKLPDTVEGFYTVTSTAGSPDVKLTGASFTGADVGKLITIYGIGPTEQRLTTSILSVTDSTDIVLNANATQTFTAFSTIAFWGTDQYANLQAGMTAATAAGASFYIQPGTYLVSQGLVCLPPANANNFNVATALCPLAQGATIIAMAPMTSLLTYGSDASNYSGYLRHAVFGDGTLDGNFLANYDADAPFVFTATRSFQLTKNSLYAGVRWGNLSAPASSGAGEDLYNSNWRDIFYLPVCGITNASPPVVQTCQPHGYGNQADTTLPRVVTFGGSAGGMTIPLAWYQISVVDATHFQLVGANSTGWGTFSGSALTVALTMPSMSVPRLITGVTTGATTTITYTGPSFVNGDQVYVEDAGGVVGLNNTVVTVASASTGSFVASGVTTSGSYTAYGSLIYAFNPLTAAKGIYYENVSDADTLGNQLAGARLDVWSCPGTGSYMGTACTAASGFNGKHVKDHLYVFNEQGESFAGYSLGGDNDFDADQIDIPTRYPYELSGSNNIIRGGMFNYQSGGSGIEYPNYVSLTHLITSSASVFAFSPDMKADSIAPILGYVSDYPGDLYLLAPLYPPNVTVTPASSLAGSLNVHGNISTYLPTASTSIFASSGNGHQGLLGAYDGTTSSVGLELTSSQGGSAAYLVVLNNAGGYAASAIGANASGDLFFPNVPNAAGNEILCYDTTSGPVTYESAVAGCVPSDEHLKDISGTVNPFVAMWRVAWYLPAYYYTFKPEAGLGDDHYVGLLAQDVCAMDAVLCRWDAKGDLNYDKIGLAAYVIAAVKGTAYSIFMLILVVFVGLFAHTKRRHNALHRRLLALESGA